MMQVCASGHRRLQIAADSAHSHAMIVGRTAVVAVVAAAAELHIVAALVFGIVVDKVAAVAVVVGEEMVALVAVVFVAFVLVVFVPLLVSSVPVRLVVS